ncbi:nuclear transport factor 2 family protein [Novosphingobium malaysiense]|uniref:nuclear transport factor 2 family protein n=1 Tax=Novosphingobium malaysiense TaxID=1348853 RepID=UPI0012E002B7|nr:nuclear transport factor 2 family protein [Novosphingobium malaysiense]
MNTEHFMDELARRNVGIARKFHGLEDGSSERPLDVLTDDVVLEFCFPCDTPVYGGTTLYDPSREGPRALVGKEAIAAMALEEKARLDTAFPRTREPEFVANGDRVIMLVEAPYTVRKTGIRIASHMAAILMDFRDGKIARIRCYEDFFDYHRAYRSDFSEQIDL